ncbi:winged helix-turn-helix domain-containing protein [Patulibacter defluvii]|uniref:winged helix-turn-helix domain-containing protein n=1 Tax=Patulibacter defluvii TaxID=3095358 RepID=UPI002A7602E8|nr:helix-turn-helix domain-containing protein [Patulibacter sp. DM4]
MFVHTKSQLLQRVWDHHPHATRSRTIDSHACRLRRKLSAHGDAFVVNVWGVGYRLVDGAAPRRALELELAA